MSYLWLKWLHIVAVISWMAGILYLYRLLVYLAEQGGDGSKKELLLLMGRRLYKAITLPAMIVAYIAGLGMVGMHHEIGQQGWFMTKFALVLVMTHFTVKAGLLVGRFAKGAANLPSGKRLRLLNEVPTLLMLVIVWLVVFKAF